MGSGLTYNLVANWGLGLRALSLVPLNRLIGSSGATSQPGSVSSEIPLDILLGINSAALPWPGQHLPLPGPLHPSPLYVVSTLPYWPWISFQTQNSDHTHVTQMWLETFQLETLCESHTNLLNKRHLRGRLGALALHSFLEEAILWSLKPEGGRLAELGEIACVISETNLSEGGIFLLSECSD